jgi:hypothetical protein
MLKDIMSFFKKVLKVEDIKYYNEKVKDEKNNFYNNYCYGSIVRI